MTPATADRALALARRAIELAPSDADAAAEAATRALELAAEGDGHGASAAAAIAWRALGLLALYASDLHLAAERLRTAVRIAEADGHRHLAGEARMSLAPVLAMQGDPAAALAECDRAAAVLTGLPRARLEAQRAALLEYQGRTDEALRAYERALPRLRRAGDRSWEGRARHNRGTLHLARGDLAKARADFLAVDHLFAEPGMERLRINAAHHLGRVEALTGDLPAALSWYAEVDELLARTGTTDPQGLIDRCAVLLSARLSEEARAAAAVAVHDLARGGNELFLAEARLALAEAYLATREPERARTEAERAIESFRRQKADRWAAMARFVAVRARWEAGERSGSLLRAVRSSIRRLDQAGWTDAASEARLLAGQIAIVFDRGLIARRELTLASRRPTASPAPSRVRAWHATALLRLLEGDRGGARSALRAGLRIVDDYRATLGATELRARAAGLGGDLALIGLRLAIDDGTPADVLRWSERWRAGALLHAPAGPARHPAVRRDLGHLRQLATEIEAATVGGENVDRLRRRQVELEAAISRRVRTIRGADSASAASSRSAPTMPEVALALGDRVLAELIEVDGRLHLASIAPHRRPRLALAALGSAADVRAELDSSRFALRRLAFGRGSPAALAAAGVALTEATRRLDELLLGPIRPALDDRPLVLVPTGALHALPWALLPSLRGRAVSVAPSIGLWFRASGSGSGRSSSRVTLVAGPRVPGAGPEITALARRYPDAVRLTGRAATADAVKTALDGTRLAHVAAHGRFRADNPLFSSLALTDGPLTVHDLESLAHPPEVLVLSACDSGLSTVHPGDELLGLAASLLGLGTRAIVASLLPVPDDATRRLMLAFHTELLRGASPAQALAHAQAAAFARGDNAALVAAASFVCLGAG